MVMLYNFNGELIEGNTFETTIQNRGLNYGDGVFETLRFANNRINFWEDHYFRLMSSMRIMRMEIPMTFSPEFLEKEIRDTILANQNHHDSKNFRVKVLINRKAGGFYSPDSNEIDYLISLIPLKEDRFILNENPLEIDLYKDFYKQKGMLSNLKLASSPLLTLASIFKTENQLDECLLVNDGKYLTEAISSNVFIVQNSKLRTPSIDSGCLKGIIRKKIIEIARKLEIEVEEVDQLSPFDLQKADEIFLSNSIKGIQWVGKYRKKTYGNELSSKLLQKLNIRAALN